MESITFFFRNEVGKMPGRPEEVWKASWSFILDWKAMTINCLYFESASVNNMIKTPWPQGNISKTKWDTIMINNNKLLKRKLYQH